MADDINDKEEKFDFTTEGEALGYISLAQARLLAMQTARESPGEYGGRFQDVPMAFDIAESSEDEDYYIVTLGMRPQGDFAGTSGQEQFFISKEGEVAHRQVLSLPRTGSGGRRLASIVTGILVAVVAIAAFVGLVVADRGPGTSPPSSPTPPPTEIVVVVPPTNTPIPTNTPLPTYTPFPTATTAPTSTPLPTQTPQSTYTPFPTSTPRPTFTPLPTATPRRLRIIPTPVPTPTPAPFFPKNYLGYIPLIDAQVTEIRFFESPFELTPGQSRLMKNLKLV